ncbi:MAG: metallophosphoesterase [Gemmatimonadota bacterium]
MNDGEIVLVHLSDLHFGGHADLEQLDELERFVPSLGAGAVVISGDLSQRARHGEFQAARAFVRRLRESSPVLVIPGNHDAQWWCSPFGIRGQRCKYKKYQKYFGPDLTPTLEIPGVIIGSALTSHGVAIASMTWNLNDMAVKGHLPKTETDRLTSLFARAEPGAARVVVLHHNVLRGQLSGRMGLARWRVAQRRLLDSGADLVLCGHDHQEDAGQIGETLAVSTANTHSKRIRGNRASAFNLIHILPDRIQIEHYRWVREELTFRRSDVAVFARAAGAPAVAEAHIGPTG